MRTWATHAFSISLPVPLIFLSSRLAAQDTYSFDHAQSFLKTYCQACHQGKSPAGGFNVQAVNSPATLESNPQKWTRLNTRIIHGEMPPKRAPAPNLDSREQFTKWVEESLRTAACSTGIKPGPAHIRRLNRDEYTATVRDLFDIHLDIGRAFPADGAGGEGFDNAAETLFLSPLHSEKYLEVAKFALDFAAKEYKSHAKIFVAKPGPGRFPRSGRHRYPAEVPAASLPPPRHRCRSNRISRTVSGGAKTGRAI